MKGVARLGARPTTPRDPSPRRQERPRSDWDRVLTICGVWNGEWRWPRVYLPGADGSDAGTTAESVADRQVDLKEGVHQEPFRDPTDGVLADALGFWRWAHQEHGL